ncbi:MoaD/ThiS family protein [Natronobacterium gregoryi]|uniref:Molybdopterin converting factor, small subunit n=2 Tax=Natronobacterium gregoryi TaxID=44930 RepID=L0AM36_NATGS|nr:molybdopterin converting factor, small subunit [Natronobacterium gregoryi SP2]PLK22089.1 thiamine biosynthesis protein ThiS [Natronobacterium gregoryi SP2]SFI52035.1 molybdopterin synthase subunit MoaD [Natronobacterium gregoryi]
MQLECVFFGPFRDAVGEKSVYHEVDAEPATVGDLLADLEVTYSDLEGELLADDEKGLAGDTVVTVDERNVGHLDGLETELDEASVVRMIPSVYGG